ncbi:MAG: cobyrinate a,c-diamide synthase [Tissierellia bacterium]|nr:cobyrinate a,c-diamide synthase [Tissierellia bacterium]
MKCIMITAGSSNSGKTLVNMGILRAMRNRGLNISAFKTGPDYIDTAYSAYASGSTSGNLDIHLMGIDGLKYSLGLHESEYATIEGAMGYFDGTHNTFENSSYDISIKLNVPAILVYSPSGEMFSAVTKIKGMVDFEDSKIIGVILNKCSKGIYEMMKPQIEKYCGVRVVGYIPKNEDYVIESRHLGLLQPFEIERLDSVLDELAEVVESNIDLNWLIENSREVITEKYDLENRGTVFAIAKDECFSFQYGENIKLMEALGRIIYFSPLVDNILPDADIYILGGGYPELYTNELSSNSSMIQSVREKAESGKKIYAYGGGLMYLASSIEGVEMCNILSGEVVMAERLQNFGYFNITLLQDSILGQTGDVIRSKATHYSVFNTSLKPEMKLEKAGRNTISYDGYSYKNCFGSYQHINFVGNIDILLNMISEE